ncbi:unnamed protein product [Brassicogethes aeneus]|uniref:Uncharacterized protein n=1 Tax=Brassicogethes aeneus TaxID=1431903 RepID=A0A9P0FF55_BRAAE|nr:unnamed protein product [Brassicogethes aeneus]
MGYSPTDDVFIFQPENKDVSEEIPALLNEPDIPLMPNKEQSNASSPATSFDDDLNDKDYQLDEKSNSNSSNPESEVDEDDLDVVNQGKITILQDIQINKPNVPRTTKSISSRLKDQILAKTRQVMCIFGEENTVSKNFVRHLTRRHSSEKEVGNILRQPLNSKARKAALASLRKETTFELFLDGTTVPARRFITGCSEKSNDTDYYPCTGCKGLYKKSYLRRHVKLCTEVTSRDKVSSAVSKSQTFAACQLDQTNTTVRLEVKDKVFDLMRGDNIAFVAKKDLLTTYFGNSYLKKHRKEKSAYTCSNKMREFARLLIECRVLLNNPNFDMQTLLHPSHFDAIVMAARKLAGYDPAKKSFNAPSLALHYGGNLKTLCDELYHLALKQTKGFNRETETERTAFLKDVKKINQLVSTRWNIKMASLANKDLQEKKWSKPLLVPLVSDVKIFREQTYRIARECVKAFLNDKDIENDYKTLVECVLALLIIFNRRRIGDVQYMKISHYNNGHRSNFKDFENALSATEKVLAIRYKRVLNSGKGSRAVVVLPEDIDEFIKMLLKRRHKYFSEENDYLFSIPGRKVKWGKGDLAIRNLTKRMTLENPDAMTSNKLRKQIATVMQILSLSKGNIKQFSNFMGHTVKTHEEFYE